MWTNKKNLINKFSILYSNIRLRSSAIHGYCFNRAGSPPRILEDGPSEEYVFTSGNNGKFLWFAKSENSKSVVSLDKYNFYYPSLSQ